jgi:hypothetical protein
MTECTRCGRQTEQSAIAQTNVRGPTALEEFNNVLWLCDGCLSEFKDWVRGDNEELSEVYADER